MKLRSHSQTSVVVGLGMDEQFHLTLYDGCNYISMLRLKLIHVSKRGYRSGFDIFKFINLYCID